MCALWTDFAFPDGARASGIVHEMPEDLRAALRSLRAASARAGGVHAAGGTLGDGSDNPVLATLRVVSSFGRTAGRLSDLFAEVRMRVIRSSSAS
jgi:hypothetical protein